MILSIESSCDDSSLALTHISSGTLLYHLKLSQDDAHSTYGGIVPEIASRLHAQALPKLFEKIKLFLQSHGKDLDVIKAVAVTTRPGLSVTLIEGLMMAKALCLALRVPLICVNHLKGHIYSPFIKKLDSEVIEDILDTNKCYLESSLKSLLESDTATPPISTPPTPEAHFPMACLLISGGHTQIIEVESFEAMYLVATSLDDSFGESFDKVAKYLGLGYPGGPIIEAKAREFMSFSESMLDSEKKSNTTTKPQAYPIPLLHNKELCFSFSGLKNAVRLSIESMPKPLSKETIGSICAGFEQSACSHLVRKCGLYLAQRMLGNEVAGSVELDSKKRGKNFANANEGASKRLKSFAIVGGASANLSVRSAIEGLCRQYGLELLLAPLEFCSDNAAMIGRVGVEHYKRGDFTPFFEAQISPKSIEGDFL